MKITVEKLLEFEVFLKAFNNQSKQAFDHFVKQQHFAESKTKKIMKNSKKPLPPE